MFENQKLPEYVLERGYNYQQQKGKEKDDTQRLSVEAIAFDAQFNSIISGKRKVSKLFLQECRKTYNDICLQLQEISKQNNNDGEFAKNILKVIKQTAKFK